MSVSPCRATIWWWWKTSRQINDTILAGGEFAFFDYSANYFVVWVCFFLFVYSRPPQKYASSYRAKFSTTRTTILWPLTEVFPRSGNVFLAEMYLFSPYCPFYGPNGKKAFFVNLCIFFIFYVQHWVIHPPQANNTFGNLPAAAGRRARLLSLTWRRRRHWR